MNSMNRSSSSSSSPKKPSSLWNDPWYRLWSVGGILALALASYFNRQELHAEMGTRARIVAYYADFLQLMTPHIMSDPVRLNRHRETFVTLNRLFNYGEWW